MAGHLKNDVPDFGWLEMAKAILFFLGKWKNKVIFYLFIIFLTFALTTVTPVFIIGKIVDFFTEYKTGESLNNFYTLAIALGLIIGSAAIIRLTIKNSLNKIQSEITYSIRVLGFEKLLDFSLKWHDNENTGNKVQKIQNGSEALSNFQRLMQNDIIVILSYIISVLIFFLFINLFYFTFSILFLAVFLIIQATYYKKQVSMQNEYNSLLEKASGSYYEGLSNVLTIKTLGVKEDFKKNILDKEELSKEYFKKFTKLGISKWKTFQIVNAVFISSFILLIGHDFLQKYISLGSIFVYINYFMNISLNAGQSTNLFDQAINIKISLGRMMPIYWDNSNIKNGVLSFPKSWENITFENASFDHGKNEKEIRVNPAIRNISLTVNRYEKIGIIGKSGSGKSTFSKLLLALYELDSGKIKIDNINFYNLKRDEITQNISLVLQESEMFNLTLKENITLMREFDSKLFAKAVAISKVDDLVEKLPEGYESLIGEKGYRLSGGERQRIGIARAIYKDPQILILDEATSSLDTKTESIIQKNMEEQLNKKTLIVIAHRISTLKNVDRVFEFDNGNVKEISKEKLFS